MAGVVNVLSHHRQYHVVGANVPWKESPQWMPAGCLVAQIVLLILVVIIIAINGSDKPSRHRRCK